MGFTLDLKGQKVGAGNASFTPIAAGTYPVSVFDASVEEYGPKSNNAGRPFLKVQYRIDDGAPGANRRLFDSIPLFTEWAPTAKNPEGSDAFSFFGFFAAVTGVKEKDFRKTVTEALESAKDKSKVSLPIPDPDTILGKKLALVVKIADDDYAFKKAVSEGDDEAVQADFKKNVISGYRPAGVGVTAGAKAEPKFIEL